MLDDQQDGSTPSETTPASGDTPPAKKTTTRKRTTKKAATAADTAAGAGSGDAPVSEAAPTADGGDTPTPAKKTTTRKRTTKKTAATAEPSESAEATATPTDEGDRPAAKKTTTRKRTTKKAAATAEPADSAGGEPAAADAGDGSRAPAVPVPLFQAPEKTTAPARRTSKAAAAKAEPAVESGGDDTTGDQAEGGGDDSETASRRKRRRGGRRRRKSGEGGGAQGSDSGEDTTDATSGDTTSGSADDSSSGSAAASSGEGESTSSRRRRRRRRSGDDDGDGGDDPTNTVTRVRSGRSANDEITAVSGSTRLEAKKQRRREGREAGRRRAPIVSEAEFLARREAVNRVMVIRQRGDITQIGVLEDNVLVEHYVARESQTSLIGNVYLGRVQNVLPSMEAAFIDIGKGRNAVLYAGEVNWSALGHKDGQPRKIESVLSSGQSILVQVTKDPIGHKGARLTSQVSLAGRFLVYVPDGTTSGISRKLPDTERNRLKTLLKDIVPDTAGVIVRTAAEGAAEDELTRDVERLKARWEDIEKKARGSAPQLLYGEPDLTLKVVRDLFTEDFAKLVIEGDDAWDTVQSYVVHVAPDLEQRLERYEPKKDQDVFAAYRIEEQIKKGLERKVWLPSGGSLVIDRTEAMTVVDVNTGKFTGSGGNLEETVTKNNLEAAEEIVRQLRLRDIGGIIVVDFIDMVLESNRDLVLRRLVECLGRDRTRHQVAEVTSLGLVQMTRKRIGTGLLESFSHDCTACHGRGVVIEEAPVEPKQAEDDGRRARRSRGRGKAQDAPAEAAPRSSAPSPKDIAAMARHERVDAEEDAADVDTDLETDLDLDLDLDADTTDDGATALETLDTDAAESEATEPASTEAPGTSDQEEEDVAAHEPVTEEAPEPVEPVDQEPSEPAPPAEPEPPRVVTRSRRRSASRPAGPPTTVPPGLDGSAEPAGVPEDPEAAGVPAAPEDETPSLHVPVKRKGGARKR
jgi:ribonuclease E